MSTLDQQRRQQLLEARAHAMRQAPSEPERRLWQHLRSSQLGVVFRRQAVLAGDIVDFYAPAARLVVEVDGAHHLRQRGADKRRDARLAALGLRVLRFEAKHVLSDLSIVVAAIADAVSAAARG